MSKLEEINRKRQTLIFRIKRIKSNIINIKGRYQNQKDTPYLITKEEVRLLKTAFIALETIILKSKDNWRILKEKIKE